MTWDARAEAVSIIHLALDDLEYKTRGPLTRASAQSNERRAVEVVDDLYEVVRRLTSGRET